MRDNTRRIKPPRSGRNAGKSGIGGRKNAGRASPQHTPQERERMQTGLRILARIIARAHLRRQASGAALDPPPDRGAGV